MAIARLDRLTYWYPGTQQPALRDVSLIVDPGLIVLTGPSGGGKSTLLRVFNGLVPHFHGGRISGAASVAGHDVFSTPTRILARSAGFVFQDPELQTVYGTVDREVAFGLENAATPRHEIATRVEAALREVGIEHLAGRAVRTLSGGERQRLALASALALRPALVVLDEPTSQLDPDGASLLLAAVQSAAGDGRAVVISEHRLHRLVSRAGRMLQVDRGEVVEVDPHAWRESPVVAPPRASAQGAEVWSLRDAAAGFDGRPIVAGVDLSGRAGEVVALAGPNGGGKTTLLRLIAGLAAPLAGGVTRPKGRIAYLPQNPVALLHRPSVRDEVQFTIDRAGEQQEDSPQRILAMLGMADLAGRYARDLSSGERQRAALAAVLPGAPELVLLDEPTRGMDRASRVALITVVAALRDRGAAVVIATHDEDLQAALADRVVDVSGGRAVERVTRNVPIAIVSLLGLALFLWPFAGSELPASTPAWTLALACLGGLLIVEAGTRQLDARGVALLAAIAALNTVLRLAVIEGIGGFSPIYFLVLCAGYVFGPSYGFLAGAFTILVSAVAGAGVGPWVPYQVFAIGWVGVAAGVAGSWRSSLPGWRDIAILAAIGAVMGWVVGGLLDIQDWVTVYRGNPTLGWQPGMDAATTLVHFGRFYVLTSLAYDTFRAVGDVLMVVVLGAPVLAALSRLKARLTFEIVPVQQQA